MDYSFGVMKHLCTLHGGAVYSKDRIKFNEIENNLKKNINYPPVSSFKLIFLCILIDILYSKYVYSFFTHYILKLSINKLEKFMNPNVYPKFYKITPITIIISKKFCYCRDRKFKNIKYSN